MQNAGGDGADTLISRINLTILLRQFIEAMEDDLNTPMALNEIHLLYRVGHISGFPPESADEPRIQATLNKPTAPRLN